VGGGGKGDLSKKNGKCGRWMKFYSINVITLGTCDCEKAKVCKYRESEAHEELGKKIPGPVVP